MDGHDWGDIYATMNKVVIVDILLGKERIMERRKALMNIMSSIVLIILALVMWFYLIPKGVKLSSAFGGNVGVTSRTFPYMTALVIGAL